MKIRQSISAVILIFMGIAGVPQASADRIGWYIGGGLGDSDPDGAGFDDDTGFKFFGGYNFNERFAVEGAYVDLGEFDSKVVPGGSFEVDGFQFAAVGSLSIGEKFSLFGKGGLYVWDADASVFRGDDGIDITFGFGVQYDTEKWGIRGEWERFDDVEPDDVDLLSVSGVLHFK